jgi:hypothetical protein
MRTIVVAASIASAAIVADVSPSFAQSHWQPQPQYHGSHANGMYHYQSVTVPSFNQAVHNQVMHQAGINAAVHNQAIHNSAIHHY